jgi:Capsular polysaccharide biosynthesis protein
MFISPKKSYIKSNLLYNMADIHSHILPGLDDGTSTFNEAVESLRWLKSNGVNRMYLTPHIMTEYFKNSKRYVLEQFDIFKMKLRNDGIEDIPELKIGAEYMLEPAFEKHKNEELLSYANRHVLVETSYITPPVGFISILEKLMEDGYSIVLAHPERNVYMDMRDYKYLSAEGVLFQLNFLSLTKAYGRHTKEVAVRLLNDGLYKYTGSDFHRLAHHESYFLSKSLTKKQTIALQCLIENNEELW